MLRVLKISVQNNYNRIYMDNNDLTSEVLITLRRIMRAVDIHSKKLEKRYSLTGPQLILLNHIVQYDEIPIGTLARDVNLSNATITGIVDRLEKRGLVERIRSSHDRRQVLIKTTEVGLKTQKSAPSPLQEDFVNKFSKLDSDEQENILAALEKVAAMMKAEHLEVAPVLSGQSLQDNGNNHKKGSM